jgi:hypothetical protein
MAISSDLGGALRVAVRILEDERLIGGEENQFKACALEEGA